MNKYNVPKKEYVKVKDKLENFSGGGDSGNSDVEYYAIDLDRLQLFGEQMIPVVKMCSLFKYTYEGYGAVKVKCILGGWQCYDDSSAKPDFVLYAIAFSKIKKNQMEANTLKDVVINGGLDISLFDSIFTPITKEEFYDLNNI